MKIQIELSRPEHQNLVIQALSNAQLLDKVQLNVLPELSQEKQIQHHGLTTIRTCYLERGEGNSLLCAACGRKLPVTPQGDLDSDQLVREIALRQW